jgi:hypothetical protein
MSENKWGDKSEWVTAVAARNFYCDCRDCEIKKGETYKGHLSG